MSDSALHTDKELFRRIAAGDESAFATLFHQYFTPLYRTLFKYTQRHADAEDIVQTVFIKVWEKRAQLAKVDNPASWLFSNARHEFIDRFRKIRRSEQYRQYLTELFEESPALVENDFLHKEETMLVQQAVACLSPKQREAYLLSREAGLTYEAIAERMGVGRSTVKEHISRALQSIKAFLLTHTKLFFILLSAYFIWRSSSM